MFDVVGIGEVLIDFSPSAPGPMGNPGFEMNPGGAPANCLTANARLGGKCAFIGSVGDDFFGRFLIKKLQEQNIDVRGVQIACGISTTIDFVSNGPDGEREFAFYRNPGSDVQLTKTESNEKWWLNTQILHFGSLGLTAEPSRTATWFMVKKAKENNVMISFDPNYRAGLWKSEKEAKTAILKGIDLSDIVKLSMEEMHLIFGEAADIESAMRQLVARGVSYAYISAGSHGAWYRTKNESGFCESFPVRAVDTTGCGDAFLGAIHYYLTNRKDMEMRVMVQRANAVAALCALGRTGIPAMPDQKQLYKFLARYENN